MLKIIERGLNHEIRKEMLNIAPDLVQNEYGTKIINRDREKIYWHIAHQRVLNKMTVTIQIVLSVLVLITLWRSLH